MARGFDADVFGERPGLSDHFASSSGSVASVLPSKAATFFWKSMINSARLSFSVGRSTFI